MPIYEYACRKCGARFEESRTMAARDEAIACPRCKSKQTERTLTTCAVQAGGETAGGGGGHAHGPACGCGRSPGQCPLMQG